MNTTTTAPLTTTAAEILELALDSEKAAPWVTVKANRWGGFDLRNTNAGSLVRITCDDETWTVRLMTLNEVERGSHTLTGALARPAFIASTVRELL